MCTAEHYHEKEYYLCIIIPTIISPCVKTPIDIDECALGLAGCDVNANCSDTEGSYECTCSLGYTGSGVECSGRWLF